MLGDKARRQRSIAPSQLVNEVDNAVTRSQPEEDGDVPRTLFDVGNQRRSCRQPADVCRTVHGEGRGAGAALRPQERDHHDRGSVAMGMPRAARRGSSPGIGRLRSRCRCRTAGSASMAGFRFCNGRDHFGAVEDPRPCPRTAPSRPARPRPGWTRRGRAGGDVPSTHESSPRRPSTRAGRHHNAARRNQSGGAAVYLLAIVCSAARSVCVRHWIYVLLIVVARSVCRLRAGPPGARDRPRPLHGGGAGPPRERRAGRHAADGASSKSASAS